MCGSNLHDKLGLEGITTGSKKSFKPVELLSMHKVIQVACGDYHTMCLTELGKVYAWGGSLHNVISEIFILIEKRRQECRQKRTA